MMHYWEKYKETVVKNCSDPRLIDIDVAYWRNKLFISTVIFLIPLSIIAIIPGIYMAIITELYMLIFADFVVIISFGVIAFNSTLTLDFRKKLMCTCLYFVTIVLLYYLGTSGPGLLYLLALSVFITLIFEFKYGVASLIVNTIICTIFALLIYFGISNSPIISEYNLDVWIAVSLNLIFLSAVSVLLIPKLFNGLQSAFDKKQKAENELQMSKIELENSLTLLEVKSKELEQFAFVASHDLQEPLRMITSFLAQLERKYEDVLDEKGKKYIFFASDGAKRMRQIILDLLDYSRVGRINSEKTEVDLSEVISDTIALNRKLIHEKNADVSSESLPRIKAIKPHMQQLFQKLISNALNYQKPGNEPKIKIRAKETESEWLFSVEDNGIGMHAEYFEKIFNIFQRLHGKDEYSGTGIGLAICKKVVEEHGGRIWVESDPGKGSTFYFTLAKNISKIQDSG